MKNIIPKPECMMMNEEEFVKCTKILHLHRVKHQIFITNTKQKKELMYDLKHQRMYKLDKNKQWCSTSQQYDFFRDGYYRLKTSDIYCREEQFLKLIRFTEMNYQTCTSLSTFFDRLSLALTYEGYIINNIKYQCNIKHPSSYHRTKILTKKFSDYSKLLQRLIKKHNIYIDLDFEEKYFSTLTRNNDDQLSNCEIINLMFDKTQKDGYDYHDTALVITLVESYQLHKFIELVNVYHFDILALLNYIIKYINPFEGINVGEGCSLLCDYYRMGTEIRSSIKKYPKYLKSIHDIITVNFKVHKKEYDENLFYQLRKPELEYEDKKYSVTIPSETKDIVDEGCQQNHCVGSYVDRIISGSTYILFMRMTVTKGDSLVTLEYKNETIIQAKKHHNNILEKEEYAFLEKYCNAKKIKLGDIPKSI